MALWQANSGPFLLAALWGTVHGQAKSCRAECQVAVGLMELQGGRAVTAPVELFLLCASWPFWSAVNSESTLQKRTYRSWWAPG